MRFLFWIEQMAPTRRSWTTTIHLGCRASWPAHSVTLWRLFGPQTRDRLNHPNSR